MKEHNSRLIYIFGAGGLGREVYCLLKDFPHYTVGGFVEAENFGCHIVKVNGIEVDSISENQFAEICKKKKDVCAVIAIGNPALRRKIAERFSNGCLFPNIIHPSVNRTGIVRFGKGNLVAHQCLFTDNIEIGDFNFFNVQNSVGHDAKIGDFNVVMPSCNISGETIIGSQNLIGAKSFILQGLVIGSMNTIGAGCVLLRNVADNCNLFGVPAKKIGI